MTTLYQPDHRSGIPPIIVIDASDLPRRASQKSAPTPDEKVFVIVPNPSVPHAFRHFRGSFTMLAKALCRSIGQYFACINRGHIARQRNI